MSGDSLYPQYGVTPPNCCTALTDQIFRPVSASRHVNSPVPPKAYTNWPSVVGVLRGPSPRSLRNRRPLGVSHSFRPLVRSNAITYSTSSRAPMV